MQETHFRCANVAIVLAALSLLPSWACAQIPYKYQGIWRGTETESETGSLCRRRDWEDNKDSGMIKVTNTAVEYWEAGCEVEKHKILKPDYSSEENATIEITFSCEGEGASWKSRELWSVKTLDTRTVLVAIRLEESEFRDDGYDKTQPSDDVPRVSLYTKCE